MVVNVTCHLTSVELARMEACLDENPDFFQDYLIRKASRQMIDSWLVAHSLPPGHTNPLSPRSDDGTDLNPSTPMSRFVVKQQMKFYCEKEDTFSDLFQLDLSQHALEELPQSEKFLPMSLKKAD